MSTEKEKESDRNQVRKFEHLLPQLTTMEQDDADRLDTEQYHSDDILGVN